MTLILKAAAIGFTTGVTLGVAGAGIAWAATERGHSYRLNRNTT